MSQRELNDVVVCVPKCNRRAVSSAGRFGCHTVVQLLIRSHGEAFSVLLKENSETFLNLCFIVLSFSALKCALKCLLPQGRYLDL